MLPRQRAPRQLQSPCLARVPRTGRLHAQAPLSPPKQLAQRQQRRCFYDWKKRGSSKASKKSVQERESPDQNLDGWDVEAGHIAVSKKQPFAPNINHKRKDLLAAWDEAAEDGEVEENLILEGEVEEGQTQKIRQSPQVRLGKNKIGMVTVPDELQEAIATQLKGLKRLQLLKDVDRINNSLLSQGALAKKVRHNRDGTVEPFVKGHNIQYGVAESQAYVAARAGVTYGAITNVLAQIAKRLPDFKPKSALDFGTGPGTALWVANRVWEDQIETNVGVDISEPMLKMADTIAKSPGSKIKNFSTRRFLAATATASLSDPAASTSLLPGAQQKYDLVISAYALEEIATDPLRKQTIQSLWDRTGDVLVLIDRGTPEGFNRIVEARSMILDQENGTNTMETYLKPSDSPSDGAHIVAPCPHARTCPMIEQPSWCHFSQRVHRNFIMQNVMSGGITSRSVNHQFTKFSYIVLRRGPRPPKPIDPAEGLNNKQLKKLLLEQWTMDPQEFVQEAYRWPRLIAPPIKARKHFMLDSCTPAGRLERYTVSKAKAFTDKEYTAARKSNWGDLWPYKPSGAVVVKKPMEQTPHHDEQDNPKMLKKLLRTGEVKRSDLKIK
ncbi:mitochondrial small ribosomal subunit Rsm22-domain-containing protein [Fimicolochytrium jonesii]|uniref:mitochondrial small ribosomal subunit Rsm22-domain-containing protein n=1 Tax=Fimicolochytrium jonesii TaxID=1396493 RepID=UPI0022FE41DA|nr:mitochondrial small ribosomal subunit Rsm22-domain-containing protein [Fimicolochytrium jonesii]KAI8820468.1 mitochondrial small ribosomal subunit Rsm22-domain-containing protein [Fimicolochytrium jonesii]